MNLLDPMKPDRLYRLDLRRFDHREFVKILVSLAVAEPGDNWEGEEVGQRHCSDSKLFNSIFLFSTDGVNTIILSLVGLYLLHGPTSTMEEIQVALGFMVGCD